MSKIADYLLFCNRRNIVDAILATQVDTFRHPPTPDEMKVLFGHLRTQKLNPAIVGSTAAFYHYKGDRNQFRPTHDVDVHIQRMPTSMPSGWTRDKEAVGTLSYFSPSGGGVDFLIANDELVPGVMVPSKVSIGGEPDFPVAGVKDIYLMKIQSSRPKDFADAIDLAMMHGLPDVKNSRLSTQARETHQSVTQWLQSRAVAAPDDQAAMDAAVHQMVLPGLE